MRWRRVEGGLAVVLERGDEVVDCLKRLAREAGIRGGFFVGMGAVDHAVLGYYDLEKKEYLRTEVTGDHEVGSLTGNLTRLEGEPFAHVHAVIAGRDLAARTGHVVSARVGATLELFVHDFGTEIVREPVPEIGLNLWRL